MNPASFRHFTEPYDGFHGLNFAEEFGPAAYITRARKEGARDFGACMSPMTAFLVLQGLETLPLRMERHVSNTRKIIEFLQSHSAVEWVSYSEIVDHPDHELSKRQLPKGAGAVFSFGIKGGREAGYHLIDKLKLFSHLANVGDAKSLVIHPASTTPSSHGRTGTAKCRYFRGFGSTFSRTGRCTRPHLRS